MKSQPTQSPFLDRVVRFSVGKHGLRYGQIPADVIARNKLQLLAMCGALLQARKSRYYKDLKPFAKGSPIERAFYLSSLSMFYDYDDFMFAGHTGHSSAIVPLVYAQAQGLTGRRFLELQTIGNEVGGRLGASIFFGPHNGQMWTAIHQIIAGVQTARLQAPRNEVKAAKIISAALSSPVFPMFDSFFSSSAKVFTASAALLTGLATARAAGQSVGGPDPLQINSSFYEQFSYVPLPRVFESLGEVFYSRTLSFKRYPGCAYIAGPVEAVGQVKAQLEQAGLNASAIDTVRIWCNLLSKKMDDLSRPYINGAHSTMTSLNFSLPINCALMLADGTIRPESFHRDSIGRPELWRLANRTRVAHDPLASRQVLRYSSALEGSLKIIMGNYFRLGPYRRRYGLGADILRLGPDLWAVWRRRHKGRTPGKSSSEPLQHRSRSGAAHGAHSPPGSKNAALENYRLYNGALAEVRLMNGRKLYGRAELPLGFAGSDEQATREFLINKVRSATSKGATHQIVQTIDGFEKLSAGQVANFAKNIERWA